MAWEIFYLFKTKSVIVLVMIKLLLKTKGVNPNDISMSLYM